MKTLKNKDKEKVMTWRMDGIWLWSARGMSPGPTMNKRHKHTTGAEDSPRMNGSRKGMSGARLLQAFLLGGCHTATHTRGQPKVWSNQPSKCSKYRRIDRICGERRPRRRAHAYTHTKSAFYSPQMIWQRQKMRKLLTAQVWQWISIFLDGPKQWVKIVWLNSGSVKILLAFLFK